MTFTRGRITALIVLICLGLLLQLPVWQQIARTPAYFGTVSSNAELLQSLNKIESYTAVSTIRLPLIYAGAYLLLDESTNETLISKNPDQPIPVASTTKMMSAMVAIKELGLTKVVTVSKEPPRVEGSKIGLTAGEQITVLDLLKGMLIYSGNDAAYALAEAYSGTPGLIAPFVEKMNEYAARYNLAQTHFQDPAGLNDDGRSTPFELSQLAKLVLSDSTLAEIVATPQTTVSSVDGSQLHELKSSNRLILPESPYYFGEATGVKTGFTFAAGHCLVASYKHGDRTLIGVVMNTVESTVTASASEMNKLFTWARSNVQIKTY